ncbi:IPT/TIG domain-containing protein [Jatrophihabitans endophyticus]|uniref:IPT/TIG domain-containing protein n=1 Tax=Jatrophihabitans endophyticus TaxID=1206085 RepID=UPI0019EC138A|nr:IPT/TIG domain-containing protein [Jatrophihabitans endophyticus]MBE7187297.1 IPT/TIG domain-containing protein [Jatrophihabitans endophyticus]
MKRSIALGSSALLAVSALTAPGVTAQAASSSGRPVVTAVQSDYGATVGYTLVVVRGSGFTGTPRVTFGSTVATNVRVVSSHLMAVYAPGHRHGAVHVKVRTNAGTSRSTEANLYTYIHQGAAGSWQAQTAPVPSGEPADDYVGVATSCPSTRACYSVGDYGPPPENATTSGPLITTRIDGRFTTQPAPVPSGVKRSGASLERISCPAVGSCAAAGTYDNGHHGLLLVLANGTWTVTKARLTTDTGRAQIKALSCGAPGACTVLSSDPVLYRLHDGTWTRSTIVPPGVRPGQHVRIGLEGLDCASAAYCLAAGEYGHYSAPFVDQLVNGKQTVRRMPNSPQDGPPTSTDAVQCPAVDRCTVLTLFANADSSGGKDASAFVTVQNGRSFAFRSITLPAVADPLSLFAYGDGTSSMSCPEVSVCFAASAYEVKRGYYLYAVARLDHAKVHVYNLPRPRSRQQVLARDIDCASSTACTAVGEVDLAGRADPYEGKGAYFTFAHGVWTTKVAAPVSGQHTEPTSTSYDAVDCPAPGACTADGDYEWDPEPFKDDGNVYYAYTKESGLVSVETPN